MADVVGKSEVPPCESTSVDHGITTVVVVVVANNVLIKFSICDTVGASALKSLDIPRVDASSMCLREFLLNLSCCLPKRSKRNFSLG